MSEHTWFIVAIIIYMATMLAIGYWSYRQTSEYDDYVLAGRGLNPFVAALSAGASDMSGWLLMGLPGALFVTGMSELWIAIGLLIGCWANWKWVAPRLRAYSEVADDSITIPSFFENRLKDNSHILRIASSVIIIVFFTFYVSSGMVSGGKYFESTFGANYIDGMLIVAVITVAYTFIGGFLAVSYTDAVQGSLMFISLVIVPVFALFYLDDPSSIWTWATEHDYGPYTEGIGNPQYFSMISGVSAATIIGNLAWGLGYFGQPHIIVRFMALRTPADAKQGRLIGVGWMLLSIVGAIFVAIVGTAFFGQNEQFSISDQTAFETIFLDMGKILFHPLIAGLILTAVLAAIMSTISSQLLVTSSSLIEDIFKLFKKEKLKENVLINLSRTAVVAVAVVAGVLALHPSDSILGLVSFAWAGFGSAFGPLVLFMLYWRRLNTPGAVAGMLTGAVVSYAWGSSALADDLYAMVPGFLSATVVTVAVSLLTAPPRSEVTDTFDTAVRVSTVAAQNPHTDIADITETALKS
ncbi:sodium/proline symporter PutP [Corynebacterium sp. sy017]|uniref:sodium/proline symporter PutP n=1 Tax=unclassified Corynebacterium TaxID=2624378 RepID=UPI0011866643|nr:MULTISPECIES: sodium/proline symporter PutP [unclassified Corynebacterium]MBP3088989.1 sodium/proline symporter PutP [Corynebacterium sp. sy017]QDZ42357.1 sodium/proline symporter PutP [Corynebacterium sp. sy039]TSD91311.1 sodium/proline symporter PutP [Corynebacterium sp. SY003]